MTKKALPKKRQYKKRVTLNVETDAEMERILADLIAHLRQPMEKLNRSAVTRRAILFYAQHFGLIAKPSASKMVANDKVA